MLMLMLPMFEPMMEGATTVWAEKLGWKSWTSDWIEETGAEWKQKKKKRLNRRTESDPCSSVITENVSFFPTVTLTWRPYLLGLHPPCSLKAIAYLTFLDWHSWSVLFVWPLDMRPTLHCTVLIVYFQKNKRIKIKVKGNAYPSSYIISLIHTLTATDH